MKPNMGRRDFIRAIGLATVSFGIQGYTTNSSGAAGKSQNDKTNILLILADDLGNRSLSCFGGIVSTPNLDRLAREGMVFNNAHAAPMCAPTRDEMFTGLSRAGRGRPDASVPFFTNHLQKLGYTTGMAGKWFVGSVFDPPLRGFDEACILVNGYRHWAPDLMVWGSGGMFKDLNQPEVQGRLNEWEIPLEKEEHHHATRLSDGYGEDVAVDFICDFMERRRSESFFAYYSSKLTHVPHAPTPDGDAKEIAAFKTVFAGSHDRNLSSVSKDARAEAKRLGAQLREREYRNQAHAYLDKMVGRLIAKLEALDLRRNTMVIFASDNGNSALDPLPEGAARLPGRKGDSREGGTRVPLVVSWPGKIRSGSTCDDLVHVQDFLPTFVEVAGGKPPAASDCDGRSFYPQLLGEKGSAREWFVGWGAHPSVWLKRVAKELGDPDMEPYKLAWVRGRRYKLYNDGRFYDLKYDLAEQRRIGRGKGSIEAEKVRRKFQEILDGYLKQ